MKIFWQLIIAFVRVGSVGYGGGPAMIPLIEAEAVDQFGWMTSEQFAEVLAMAYSLPGPVATKMTAAVGFRVAGYLGALVGLIALLLPSIVGMLLLLTALRQYRDVPFVQGMINAVYPVVVVLLALLTFDTTITAIGASSIWVTLGLGTASAVGIRVLGLHPVYMIVAAMAYGAAFVR